MKIRISVSDLVDFSCRTGDLVGIGPQGPSAQEGIRAHQKVQRARKQEYDAEVTLKATETILDSAVTIGGRIDLLNAHVSPPVIQEIKTTLVPAERVSESARELHWSQLKVYGFCYLCQLRSECEHEDERADSVALELLWLNLLDQSQTIERDEFEFDELKAFTLSALERYVAWYHQVDHWRTLTRESARTLEFPHREFRTGQRDMAAATYRTLRDSGVLLCEAPTGIGKTISALFPAIKAIGDGYLNKIVYLTAKTSGRAIALDTATRLRLSGLKMTSLVIQSKATICHCSNGTCQRQSDGRCPLTIGFFDRLPDARQELLDLECIDVAVLDAVATRHQLCPFELSLQMLPWVTLAVCDYNYVFDPLVRLSCFTKPDKRLALLLDESHNLVDRARNMYSARLTRVQNRQVQKDCEAGHPALARALAGLTRALDRQAKRCDVDELVETEAPGTVTKSVERCLESMTECMDSGTSVPDSAREWFRELFRYRVIEELFSEQHRALTRTSRVRGYKDIELRLLCVNASGYLGLSFKQFRSAIVFSATLRPAEYYQQALGLPDNTQGMSLASPFDSRQLGVFLCPFVDTRYRARSDSIDDLVKLIHHVLSARSGNYLIFFPSYAYLEQVCDVFRRNYPNIDTVKQQRTFTLDDRSAFLDNFSAEKPVVGFAIMGGVFGEGIDYQGEQLIGCIIVGTGLPALGAEQQLISADYVSMGRDGFDYAFRYPGFTRVLQTAGRVIRSEQDKGIVVLVDQRFSESFYRALYPSHWCLETCQSVAETQSAVVEFWGEKGSSPGQRAQDLC